MRAHAHRAWSVCALIVLQHASQLLRVNVVQ
jgi:hypothetical protein